MKLPQIEYQSPTRLCDAVELLSRPAPEVGQSAAALAGGQSLIPLLAARARRAHLLVDLNRLPGLAYLTTTGGQLAIGALTRHRTLETAPAVAAAAPLLALAAARTAHPSVRNRGTLGGTLALAAPGSELLTAALALDAQLELTGPAGTRHGALRGWITGRHSTRLGPGELITGIRIPPRPGRTGQALHDLAHPTGGRPVACVVAVVEAAPDGTLLRAELTVSTRASTPVVLDLTDRLPDLLTDAEDAAGTVPLDTHPVPAETNGPPAAYCRHATRVLTRRALAQAITRARRATP